MKNKYTYMYIHTYIIDMCVHRLQDITFDFQSAQRTSP